MVEGLTFFSSPPNGQLSGIRDQHRVGATLCRETAEIEVQTHTSAGPSGWRSRSRPHDIETHEILVTLAERPHPFPSRTRQLSSPAPKILRG